jgi:hypothetical protein
LALSFLISDRVKISAIYLAHDTATSSRAYTELSVTDECFTFYLPNSVEDTVTLSSELYDLHSHLCMGTLT